MLQIVSPLLSHESVPFDVILRVSHQTMSHWSKVIDCEQSCTDEHTIIALSQIASRLMTFYEAALCSYSGTRFDGIQQVAIMADESASLTKPAFTDSAPHGFSSTQTLAGSLSEVSIFPCSCASSQMQLGALVLEQAEARVLAEQMLTECLLQLNPALDDLKNDVDEMLQKNIPWQTIHRLKECDIVINQTMNRLASFLGQIRSDAKKKGCGSST